MQNKPQKKKAFGFYILILSALLSLAAGVYFVVIHGTFGLDSTHNGVCYDPWIVGLLIGGSVLSALLAFGLKMDGLASAVAAAASGAGICLFIYRCYWYVVDVFVGIDEKHGFDPKFITFCALLLVAFLLGEIAIYARRTKKA
mgnify:CR=1 FL=1